MRAITLALIAALALAAGRPAWACTEAVLNDTCTGATVSSRTLSFPTALDPQVSYVRAGASLLLSEVGGTIDKPLFAPYPGKAIAAKFNFVCTSVARKQLGAYYGAKSVRSKESWLWCTDGLNAAGLSCALQYQGLTTSQPVYNPQNKAKPDALNYEDLCTFALARFDSAPALRRYIEGSLQLTHADKIYSKWATTMTQGRGNALPWHFSITDAKGRGIIVQARAGKIEVLDNTYGVFTNEPFYQEMEKGVAEYERKMLSNPAGVYPSVKTVAVPELEEGPSVFAAGAKNPIQYLPLPGDYSGQSRFIRMALTLKYAAKPTCWDASSLLGKSTKETLNPAYVPAGAPATNQALLAVLGITYQVYLPRGINDHGKAGSAEEFTPFSTLRDHKLKAYYVRTANSPLYRRYSLAEIDFKNTGKRGIVTVPLTTPGETWFVDERL